MQIWLVGRLHDDVDNWEVLGVYSSEELALARCSHSNDFIGPLTIDENLPDEPVDWPGSYFPITSA